ncbi:PDZ domain-containing protein [Cellulomonas sp. HZM]|uniref:YlbL family protein n=1 Tax=Cellulomonas sp. HZM TaxID=1454010 RepID=UPI000A8EB616|nr:PDZ domain-containing protein [Cellulomonas sp. HZM]
MADEHQHPDVPPADDDGEAFVVPPGDGPRPRSPRRAMTLTASMLVAAVAFALLVVLPTGYAVSSPGPTKDVLGKQDGTPLIQISGATTYPSTGELRLTTVSGTGGPGYPSTVLRVLDGWASRWSVAQPREVLYPTQETREQIDQENTQAMTSSQENASVAALTELGYEVPATLTVAGTVEGSDAAKVLKKDDVITSLDGSPVPDYQTLLDDLSKVQAGDTITLGITRDGKEQDVSIVTGKKPDGSAMIGVYIDPTFDMPVKIDISIDGIGGPSAGTMFALGIIDKMTKEDEANGVDIAGTGTMDVSGDVGQIGGIRQKLEGARRDGATWFLAPASNCKDVVGHVPSGLHVARVSTLHDAREAMVAIGAGKGSTLPTCEK